jgi:hypothetical protein
MNRQLRGLAGTLFQLLGFSLAVVSSLPAQQPIDDPQRVSLVGLRRFAVHARVQRTQRSTLPSLDEALLRSKLEVALRREGMELQGPNDVRDGAAAQVSLMYLVVPVRDQAGRDAGFAGSACIHASQLVRIPRVIAGSRYTYTMAPTWSSCAMVVGAPASYRDTILQNADEQIARFLRAWRAANETETASPRHSL